VKTNDVTNNFGFGDVGWSIELGRPGVSTKFEDVEKVAVAVARHGVEFIDLNPVSMLVDPETGRFTERNPWGLPARSIRKLRALSAIIECKTPIEKVPEMVRTLKGVSEEVDTVFSVGIISRWRDGGIEVVPFLEGVEWVRVRPNGKHNGGLGRAGEG